MLQLLLRQGGAEAGRTGPLGRVQDLGLEGVPVALQGGQAEPPSDAFTLSRRTDARSAGEYYGM